MLDQTYDIVRSDGRVETRAFRDILSKYPRTILYFYIRDNTPGCTLETEDFTRLLSEFQTRDIAVVGVSRDSVESHQHCIQKYMLGVDLISDPGEVLHHAFGVIAEKNNYGKISVGVVRSTFLLDSEGEILREWRGVKATSHADRVLHALKNT